MSLHTDTCIVTLLEEDNTIHAHDASTGKRSIKRRNESVPLEFRSGGEGNAWRRMESGLFRGKANLNFAARNFWQQEDFDNSRRFPFWRKVPVWGGRCKGTMEFGHAVNEICKYSYTLCLTNNSSMNDDRVRERLFYSYQGSVEWLL
jgi:hypothetical protein